MKHEEVINDVVGKGIMSKIERPWGNKTLIKKHKISEKAEKSQYEIRAVWSIVSRELNR